MQSKKQEKKLEEMNNDEIENIKQQSGIDYNEYTMSKMEKVKWFLIGGIVSAIVMYVFYERWYVSLILGIAGGIIFLPMKRKQIIEKRKKVLTMQFKELLESIKSSLGSESVDNAFMKAKSDLRIQFPEDAYIMKELTQIMKGVMLRGRLEDLLMDFGERSGVEDIRNFTIVFKSCYRKGGNIQDIIRRSINIINEKIEVNMDIEAMVAGQKSEQTILLVLPVIFVIMLKAMGGMVDLDSGTGILSMTIAIAIFLAAYGISRKIMKIDV